MLEDPEAKTIGDGRTNLESTVGPTPKNHPRLQILFVSTSYPCSEADWQGTFIRNLLTALAKRGDLDLRFWGPAGELPEGTTDATGNDGPWLSSLQHRGGIAHSLRNGGARATVDALSLLRRLRRAYTKNRDVDVFHINWLHNALPLFGLPGPTIISCLGSDYALLDRTLPTRLLNLSLKGRESIIAPNAGWMEKRLQQHIPAASGIETVPFGVDERWYTIERIPGRKPIWLAVFRLTRHKVGPLFEWGNVLRERGGELHLFGPMQEDVEVPSWVQYHGPATPEELRTHWFPRASGLISLSDHSEGLPQVMLEALAAGIPVIASRIPGHETALKDGDHGRLVETQAEFEGVIRSLTAPTVNMAAGIEARRWARSNVGTWADCASRYRKLYTQVLNTGSS